LGKTRAISPGISRRGGKIMASNFTFDRTVNLPR
jgi:hypothetical protein